MLFFFKVALTLLAATIVSGMMYDYTAGSLSYTLMKFIGIIFLIIAVDLRRESILNRRHPPLNPED